jgi:hypothetical protein
VFDFTFWFPLDLSSQVLGKCVGVTVTNCVSETVVELQGGSRLCATAFNFHLLDFVSSFSLGLVLSVDLNGFQLSVTIEHNVTAESRYG